MALLRDPEKYFIVFWGMPEATAPWGWRFEGHHLSLNFTVRGDSAIATTPSFFGANPAEVRKGPKRGTRVLERSMGIAADVCIYTNRNLIIEELPK